MIKNQIKKAIRLLKKKEYVPIVKSIPKDELLKDKIALITGGSGGLGMAIASCFLNAGAKVIIAGTNEEKLARCCNLLCQNHGKDKIRTILFDIRNMKDIKSLPEKSAQLFVEKRIDILVNCAGVANNNGFFSITEDEYDRVMAINLKGTFFVSQEISRYMIHNNIKGHILNVSSSSALRPAWTPYQMSKWAINGFTKGLADTLLPYGIIVNAIGPGQTATKMLGISEGDSIFNPNTAIKRYALPDEIANLALFLVAGTGDYVVGETYYISGGSGTITMHH